jgi:hypothetical protein
LMRALDKLLFIFLATLAVAAIVSHLTGWE